MRYTYKERKTNDTQTTTFCSDEGGIVFRNKWDPCITSTCLVFQPQTSSMPTPKIICGLLSTSSSSPLLILFSLFTYIQYTTAHRHLNLFFLLPVEFISFAQCEIKFLRHSLFLRPQNLQASSLSCWDIYREVNMCVGVSSVMGNG